MKKKEKERLIRMSTNAEKCPVCKIYVSIEDGVCPICGSIYDSNTGEWKIVEGEKKVEKEQKKKDWLDDMFDEKEEVENE